MLNQYTGINTNTPSYDDDGNMLFLPSTTGVGKQFTWDGQTHMITTTNGNTVVVNAYDAQSRPHPQAGQCGRQPPPRTSATSMTPGICSTSTTCWPVVPARTRYYAWGLDLSQSLQGAGGVGGLLYTQAGASAERPACGTANGNATEYVDLATGGAVTSRQAYDGFGKPIAQTGSRPARTPSRTKYEDEETGLLYYGYRFFPGDRTLAIKGPDWGDG